MTSLTAILFANWYNNGVEIPEEGNKEYWDRVLSSAEKYASTRELLIMNGCDHQPVQKNLSKALENARKTLIECGQLENVQLVLSDGLDEIEKNSCDEIVIAGMGGILIKEILERTEWVFNENIRIVAQPMTHAEVLREFFLENGFVIEKETAATDGRHHYCIISAVFKGEKKKADSWYYFVGELVYEKDEISALYINKIINTLEKKLHAMQNAGVEDKENIAGIIADIKQKLSEVKNG